MDTINLDELEKLIHVIFSNLKDKFGENLKLENDYYWDIFEEDLYDPYKTPEIKSLGQISEELEIINRIIKDYDNFVMYDLKRISEILKTISYEYPEYRKTILN